jgi:hypothetical protein
MPDSLPDLLDSRDHLLRELTQLGDFQPGSISSVTRRCGKPNCHCAQPSDPGHGPHRQLTQKIAGKTVTQTLSSATAVRKAEKEIAEFRRFQALAQELVEVNQKICRLRPLAVEDEPLLKKNGGNTPARNHPRSSAFTAADFLRTPKKWWLGFRSRRSRVWASEGAVRHYTDEHQHRRKTSPPLEQHNSENYSQRPTKPFAVDC